MGPSISLCKQVDKGRTREEGKKQHGVGMTHQALPQVAPARHAAMASPATDLKATDAYVFFKGRMATRTTTSSVQVYVMGIRRQARKISAKIQ